MGVAFFHASCLPQGSVDDDRRDRLRDLRSAAGLQLPTLSPAKGRTRLCTVLWQGLIEEQ